MSSIMCEVKEWKKMFWTVLLDCTIGRSSSAVGK
jgi:hypothetical protein